MKYEKPVILNLGEIGKGVGAACGGGSSARGCNSYGSIAVICSVGDAASPHCTNGTDGLNQFGCNPGTGATSGCSDGNGTELGHCVDGSNVAGSYYCAIGTGGQD